MLIMICCACATGSFKSLTSAQSPNTQWRWFIFANHIPFCFAFLTCIQKSSVLALQKKMLQIIDWENLCDFWNWTVSTWCWTYAIQIWNRYVVSFPGLFFGTNWTPTRICMRFLLFLKCIPLYPANGTSPNHGSFHFDKNQVQKHPHIAMRETNTQ